tara:strand:- start:245 stop:424 length:180 start_codon:yes stop_codon:yes gene_type:complete
MTNEEKIEKLESQLKAVLDAYYIIEEYACMLVGGDCEENQTITQANEMIEDAFKDLLNN